MKGPNEYIGVFHALEQAYAYIDELHKCIAHNSFMKCNETRTGEK